MARVIHFDITADDPDQAIKFYGNVFDWKFKKWEGPMEYWLIETGPDSETGINGGLVKREKSNYVVNTIQVKDIDKAIEDIKANGGKIVTEKGPIPGVGYFAQFEDTEGNLLGIIDDNPDAK